MYMLLDVPGWWSLGAVNGFRVFDAAVLRQEDAHADYILISS